MGIDLSEAEDVPRILARLKDLEHQGYHFEVADASFELLIERETGSTIRCSPSSGSGSSPRRSPTGASPPRRRSRSSTMASASRRQAAATGHQRPRTALRAALEPRVPELAQIELVNFKVRILDEDKGTGATTRVLLDSSDGEATWGALGVSHNVIEASWDALIDSLAYGVRRHARHAASTGSAS